MKASSAELQQHEIPVSATNGFSFSINARHTIVYPAILLLICLTINYCFVLYAVPAITFANLVYGAAFFLIGLAHIFILKKWLAHVWQDSFASGTLYTIIMALLVGMSTLILYYLGITQQQQLLSIAAVATAAFLLPYGFYATVYYFKSIGAKQYEPWFVPPDVEPDTRASLMLNSIHFKIKLPIKLGDSFVTSFILTLSPRLTLSTVFIRFLYEKHDVIEMTDSNGSPYGWLFSIKKKFGKKMLDPDLTLTENGVEEDDVIIVERIVDTQHE